MDEGINGKELGSIISAIPQELINQYAENGGDLSALLKDQRAAIPQEIINQYFLKGLADKYMNNPLERWMPNIPQKLIHQYVANGGDLRYLLDEQIAAIPQDVINQRILNGGSLYRLTENQLASVPQEYKNQYFVKFKGEFSDLPEDWQMLVTQEIINQHVANGGSLYELSNEQIASIPQDIFIQLIESGKSLSELSENQMTAFSTDISQECLNMCCSNGGNASRYLVSDKLENIPEKIKQPSKEAITAIILFSIGKIEIKDLPVDVFVNYDTRKQILGAIKQKTIQHFKEICEKNGYVEDVPKEGPEAFDRTLKRIEEEVKVKQIEGVKALTYGTDFINDIEMGW